MTYAGPGVSLALCGRTPPAWKRRGPPRRRQRGAAAQAKITMSPSPDAMARWIERSTARLQSMVVANAGVGVSTTDAASRSEEQVRLRRQSAANLQYRRFL
jgi:hypothetical protein